jgi:riboflavin synthase
MFSGIVSSQGTIVKIHPTKKRIQLIIHVPAKIAKARLGDSIAVNGCCLTVAAKRGTNISFDVLKETWKLTTFQYLQVGGKVNLESSLAVGDLLGGHFVSGHIDGIGRVVERKTKGTDVYLKVAAPASIKKMLAYKGSISLDGVSLTVASVKGKEFGVWLIPHTMKITTLGCKREGDYVNLEADLLAKYVQNILTA